MGAKVVGTDAAETNIKVARAHSVCAIMLEALMLVLIAKSIYHITKDRWSKISKSSLFRKIQTEGLI